MKAQIWCLQLPNHNQSLISLFGVTNNKSCVCAWRLKRMWRRIFEQEIIFKSLIYLLWKFILMALRYLRYKIINMSKYKNRNNPLISTQNDSIPRMWLNMNTLYIMSMTYSKMGSILFCQMFQHSIHNKTFVRSACVRIVT